MSQLTLPLEWEATDHSDLTNEEIIALGRLGFDLLSQWISSQGIRIYKFRDRSMRVSEDVLFEEVSAGMRRVLEQHRRRKHGKWRALA